MLILNRYITFNFIKTLLLCMFTFIFLYVVIDLFSNLEDVIRNSAPPLKIVEYYLYSIPVFFSHTAPVATLLATLFTLGHLNQNNEIIAMRACGMSIFNIVAPLIFFGLFLSLALLAISETIVPTAQRMSKLIKDNYIEKSPDQAPEHSIKNVAVYGFNNRLFFINKLYPNSNTIEGLTVLEHDNKQNVVKKVYAQKAIWRNNRWVLYQCFIYYLDEEKQIKGEPLYFSDTTFKIQETPQDFLRQNIPVEHMNIRELGSYASKLAGCGAKAPYRALLVDLYQKTSFPFTSLVILLIGIPSSIIIRRRAIAFSSIGLCIGISFLFYVLFVVAIALGKQGLLPPFLAAWIVHIIFAGISLYLITKIP